MNQQNFWPGNGMNNGFYQTPNHLMANPSAHVGVIHTGNIPTSRRMTFGEMVQMKHPDGAVQILPLLNQVSRGTTKALSETYMVKTAWVPRVQLMEEMPAVRRGQHSTIKVQTTEGLIPNMTFVTGPFGEQVMITDVVGPNELVVIRGLSTVLPMAVKKGTDLIYSGDVFEEGSMRPLMRFSGSSEHMVHTQIFRHSWGQTNTVRESLIAQDAKSGGVYGVDASDSKNEALLNHAHAIESWLLFGKHKFSIHNGMPMRTGAGILEFISANAPQNIVTAVGALNISDLGHIFRSLSDQSIEGAMNGNPKLYVHEAVIDTVTEIASKQGLPMHTVNQQTDIIGRQYTKFATPHGSYDLIRHPRFKRERSLYGAALAFNPASFALKYLGNRDTQHSYYNADVRGALSQIQDPTGLDQVGGTFTTEVMLVCRNPAANGMYFNLLNGRPSFDWCCGSGNGYTN